MNNLNDLKNKLEAMKESFKLQHADLVVSGKMSVTDFAAMTHGLVQAIAVLEKVVKELSNGMYKFNSDGAVSVTYLSHFRNGRFHHDLGYKTVEFSFIECLMNLKGLNIDKHVLLSLVNCENELKTDTVKKAKNVSDAKKADNNFFFTNETRLAMRSFKNMAKMAKALLGEVRVVTSCNYCHDGFNFIILSLYA